MARSLAEDGARGLERLAFHMDHDASGFARHLELGCIVLLSDHCQSELEESKAGQNKPFATAKVDPKVRRLGLNCTGLMMPECNLCGESKKLCKAHIVPQSFNFPKIPGERPSILISNHKGFRTKRSQTGVYDPNILCSDCDRKLGDDFDSYAARELLNATNRKPHRLNNKIVLFEYPDCDPYSIIGFALSVLWRASLSDREMYRRVFLGPYAAKIKSYLLGEIGLPTNISVYPTEFGNTEALKGQTGQLDPHEARHDGVRVWHLYANRFCFYIRTDNKPANKYDGIELGVDRPMRILVRDFMQSKELDVIRRIAHGTDG